MRAVVDALLARMPLWRFASPANFYPLAGRLIPRFAFAALLLTMCALAMGLLAPAYGARAEASRIVLVHVPAAWLSLLLYLAMAACAALALALNARLPALLLPALAPTGALFTFIALWTGWLWAQPTWGASWVWDARLTCELIQLFLFIGVLALRSFIADSLRAELACAVLVLVGMLNIPMIYFSLSWWNTLHQGTAASLIGSSAMARAMLGAILLMTLAFCMYSNAVVLARVRCLMLERDADPAGVEAERVA